MLIDQAGQRGDVMQMAVSKGDEWSLVKQVGGKYLHPERNIAQNFFFSPKMFETMYLYQNIPMQQNDIYITMRIGSRQRASSVTAAAEENGNIFHVPQVHLSKKKKKINKNAVDTKIRERLLQHNSPLVNNNLREFMMFCFCLRVADEAVLILWQLMLLSKQKVMRVSAAGEITS